MAEPGHNVLGGNSADQLRAYVVRIEQLNNDIRDLNVDKREIYAEVKACGFDKRVIRHLVARRLLDPTERAEGDALLELYEQILTTGTTVDPLED